MRVASMRVLPAEGSWRGCPRRRAQPAAKVVSGGGSRTQRAFVSLDMYPGNNFLGSCGLSSFQITPRVFKFSTHAILVVLPGNQYRAIADQLTGPWSDNINAVVRGQRVLPARDLLC